MSFLPLFRSFFTQSNSALPHLRVDGDDPRPFSPALGHRVRLVRGLSSVGALEVAVVRVLRVQPPLGAAGGGQRSRCHLISCHVGEGGRQFHGEGEEAQILLLAAVVFGQRGAGRRIKKIKKKLRSEKQGWMLCACLQKWIRQRLT